MDVDYAIQLLIYAALAVGLIAPVLMLAFFVVAEDQDRPIPDEPPAEVHKEM